MISFHSSSSKNFKYFYIFYGRVLYHKEFTSLSDPRFIQLTPRLFIPLCILLHSILRENTRLYIADATSLPVFHALQKSIVAVKITPANIDEQSVLDDMMRDFKGGLFADKGFISQALFKKLHQRELKLIPRIRKT